jgi:CRISPR/Cas system-associated endonuclease Cas1
MFAGNPPSAKTGSKKKLYGRKPFQFVKALQDIEGSDGHGLKRLVCISEDGFLSLSGLKWLADIGASFTMLSRTGKVLFVTGPTAPSDTRLRRSQALALGNGAGVEVSRVLIDAKLQGQERVAREGLHDPTTAEAIAILRERLPAADSVEVIRTLEAHAAVSYFGAWRNVPVLWPKADLRKVPDHWVRFRTTCFPESV